MRNSEIVDRRIVMSRGHSITASPSSDPAAPFAYASTRRPRDRGALDVDAIRDAATLAARRMIYTPVRQRAAREIGKQAGAPELAAYLLAEYARFWTHRSFVGYVVSEAEASEPAPRALAGALGSRHVAAARKAEIRADLGARKLERRLRWPGPPSIDPKVADYVTFFVLRLRRLRGGRHLSNYGAVARFLGAPAAGINLNDRKVRNIVFRTTQAAMAAIRDWPQDTISVECVGGRYRPPDPALLLSPHALSDDPPEWPHAKMAVFKRHPNTCELLLELRASEFQARRGVCITPPPHN